MSEPKIQSTPAVPAGAQRPLITDAMRQTHGFVGSQVFPLSGHPGTPVNNDQPSRAISPNVANGEGSRPPENVSNLNAGCGREFTAKRVDQVDVSDFGRHMPAGKQGDVAKASLTQAAQGQGGPRSSTGQFPNGRADTAGKGGAFGNEHANKSYPTPDAGD